MRHPQNYSAIVFKYVIKRHLMLIFFLCDPNLDLDLVRLIYATPEAVTIEPFT